MRDHATQLALDYELCRPWRGLASGQVHVWDRQGRRKECRA